MKRCTYYGIHPVEYIHSCVLYERQIYWLDVNLFSKLRDLKKANSKDFSGNPRIQPKVSVRVFFSGGSSPVTF